MTETISNVAVFDGTDLLSGLYDVSLDGGVITALTRSADGADQQGTLLPGLIDAHVHFRDPAELDTLARFGVTTALDMGTWPAAFVAELRAAGHGAGLRSAGSALAGPGGPHARIPGFPAGNLVANPGDARRGVAARVAEGADYLKLILERPGAGGPDLATATAAVDAAHAAGLRVVAHASAVGAYELGIRAGVDILTHAPLDAVLTADLARAATVVVPTLTMMRGTARNLGLSYDNARDSVTALHRAGALIVAGTDANNAPGVPAAVPHGSSLHDELQLLTEAGLTPLEALRAATSAAADAFGLTDRGRIAPGLRADLLLVTGDPTADITATRGIRCVRIAGKPLEI